MAECTPTADDPGGRLTIADTAGQRLVRIAALKVAGVEPRRGTFGAITGRGLPKADVDMAVRRPAIRSDIAVRWPAPAFDVARRVQTEIREELTAMADIDPRRVDVAVGAVLPVLARRVDDDTDDPAIAEMAHQGWKSERRARGVRAIAGAAVPATVLAVGLLAVAAIALHDLIIGWNWASGDQWCAAAMRWVGRLSWQSWMLPAAIGSVIVGLWLGWLAIAPRRRTHLSLSTCPFGAAMYLRPTDLALRCSAVARDVDGVDGARTTVGPRKVTVKVQTDTRSNTGAAENAVRRRVSAELAGLTRVPRLVVKSAPTRET